MLDFAIKYKDELINKNHEYWSIGNNFNTGISYHKTLTISNDTWQDIQMVSLNSKGKVAGYLSVNIDRDGNRYYGLIIQNYDNNILTFGRDVYKFIFNIISKEDFRKLSFSVYTDNPIMKSYDKLVKKYGGRIVGTYLEHDKLIDGKYHDLKLYEILKKDIINFNYIERVSNREIYY